MYDGYKANRGKGLKGLNRTVEWLSPEEEEKAAVNQISRFGQYTESLPVASISIDRAEADDVIAYICNQMFPDDKKVIMSTDKDFFQLVSDKTTVYRPTTKEIVDRQYLQDKFSIAPNNFVLYRAIDGDPSDNLPGVKGIAIKTVNKLYPELSETTQYDVQYIIDKAKENLDNTKFAMIFNNADIIERNHKLMQLAETILPGDKTSIVVDVLNNQKMSLFDRRKLNQMMAEDKMYIQQRGMSGWYSVYSDADSRARVFNRKLIERK
jgi:5'-3' exonuclease